MNNLGITAFVLTMSITSCVWAYPDVMTVTVHNDSERDFNNFMLNNAQDKPPPNQPLHLVVHHKGVEQFTVSHSFYNYLGDRFAPTAYITVPNTYPSKDSLDECMQGPANTLEALKVNTADTVLSVDIHIRKHPINPPGSHQWNRKADCTAKYEFYS